MGPLHLPPELDDIIIDHFHDDRFMLGRCALVCRAWLPATRYHAWRYLPLKCTSADLTRFSSLLDASPSVAYYVRDVTVTQKQGQFCTWDDLTLLHSTLAILSRLPNLHTLTLDGLWFGSPTGEDGLSWSAITFPSVRKLTISTCSFDVFDDVSYLCSAFPALKEIHFDGVWWGRWVTGEGSRRITQDLEHSGSGGPRKNVPLHWKELDLGSCFSRDTVVEWLFDSLAENSIRSLRLPLIGTYDTRLKDLLEYVGPSLEHLDIGSPSTSASYARDIDGNPSRPLESLLDLSSCTSLRIITLGVPTYQDPASITRWLAAILTQVASPVVEEVRFAIYPILRGDAADAEIMLAAFGWDAVTRILLGFEPERIVNMAHASSRSRQLSRRRVLRAGTRFVALKKVTFCAGRAADYVQIPSAFVPLAPVMKRIAAQYFDSLKTRGIEMCFEADV